MEPGVGYSEDPEATKNTDYSSSSSRTSRILQRINPDFFLPNAKFSSAFPPSYQLAGQSYPVDLLWKHRDVLRRIRNGMKDDQYLNLGDGRLNHLFVQTTNHYTMALPTPLGDELTSGPWGQVS